jgi:superfamily II DNA helicase RecQ
MQSMEEIRQAQNDLQNGAVKLVFVAPERLQNEQFL